MRKVVAAAQSPAPNPGCRWHRFLPAISERAIAYALVAISVAFNARYLYPEVGIPAAKLNDGLLHSMLLHRMIVALRAGQDPTDPWFAPVATGYPIFHYYQHLAYVPPAIVGAIFHGVGAATLINWTSYVLLCIFPISIYWSMRRFGFSPIAGAMSALLAPLVSTNYLYGFDDGSYVWIGFGLYTQLWGMVLLGPTLAQGYTTIRTGRGYFWAVLLASAMLLCHLVLGYVAIASLVLFAFLRPESRELLTRGKRLALLLGLVAIVTSYMVVPFVIDRAYLNRSVWELQYKYDAYGHEFILRALFGGRLFDYGRIRVLTALVGVGALLCAWRWRDERYRIPVVFGGLWLLLYFGRPTWGVLLNLLPFTHNMHLHRLVAGVHFGGIMLMGLALAIPWRWALARKGARYLLLPAIITATLLVPVYKDRREYLQSNESFMTASDAAIKREQPDLDRLEAAIRHQPPGRVYAGLAGKWGKDYRVGEVPLAGILNAAGFDMIGYLYHSLSYNSDVQVLFDDQRSEQYNLFNVRYVVAPIDRPFPPWVQPIGDFGRHRLYRVLTTGYFDLVNSAVTFEGNGSDFYPSVSKWLASDLPALKQHPQILFEGTTGPGVHPQALTSAPEVLANMPFGESAPLGEITSERVYDNSYAASITVERPGFLILKQTFHPGWHAYVDGIEAKTVMLMPSYVGIKVVPGRHVVRVVYKPERYRQLLLVLGLVALATIAVAEGVGPRLLHAAPATPVKRRRAIGHHGESSS